MSFLMTWKTEGIQEGIVVVVVWSSLKAGVVEEVAEVWSLLKKERYTGIKMMLTRHWTGWIRIAAFMELELNESRGLVITNRLA